MDNAQINVDNRWTTDLADYSSITAKPVGRPPEYMSEYADMVDDYLKKQQDEYKIFKTPTGGIVKQYVKLPTRKGFAGFICHPYDTMTEWANQFPEFNRALQKIDVAQEQVLLEKGLSGDYNSTIAKLVLSSNHGYAEKTDNRTEYTVQLQSLENALRTFGKPKQSQLGTGTPASEIAISG